MSLFRIVNINDPLNPSDAATKGYVDTAVASISMDGAATITPHRSLRRGNARFVLALCSLAVIAASIPFIFFGAWPVAGFLGIDLVALAIAFRASYRTADSREEVVLTSVDLCVRRIDHRGARTEQRFNPMWTRLLRENDEDFGLMSIALVSHGRRTVFAKDLSPGERVDFANAFEKALASVKRGLPAKVGA